MERALIAYLAGALLGVGARAAEIVLSGGSSGLASFAIYSLVGGLAAALTRAASELVWPGYGARAASFAVLSGFGTLYLGYFANVKVLPTEPFWTPLSLSLDLVILAMLLACAYRVLRSHRAQELRMRWGPVTRAGGALAVVGGVIVLAGEWPRPLRAETARKGEGPNLLLVVMDSVRRDRLSLHVHSRPTSPDLDRWASRARVFTRAYAASSWTVPSVRELLQAGTEGALPARLAAQGYVTACFTDNPHLSNGSPLVAGFDRVERSVRRWRELLRGTVLGETVERVDSGDDQHLVRMADRWARHQAGPVFLYVHLMDSHTPYRHPPIDGKRRGGRQIEFPREGMSMTAEEAEDVVARYEGGVRSADRAVGRILAAAEGWGRPWLAIVTSDHGESLGEDGRWFHGGSLHQELLDIPLLVMGTGVEPGRFEGIVGHGAAPATLAAAAAAGLACSSCGQPDLRTSAGGAEAQGALPPRLLYRIVDELKVTFDRRAGKTHLFDLKNDPRELRDLAPTEGRRAAELAAPLTHPPPALPEAMPLEEIERLKALGYTTGGLGPASSN